MQPGTRKIRVNNRPAGRFLLYNRILYFIITPVWEAVERMCQNFIYAGLQNEFRQKNNSSLQSI